MPVSEKSLRNLKRPPKGTSANPSGRPKDRPITVAYKWLATQKVPKKIREKLQRAGLELPEGATWAQAVGLGQFLKAISGHAPNASEIREAIEGKATQRIELSGSDGTEIPIRIQAIDLSQFTKEELVRYRALVAKGSAPRRDDG